MAAHPTAIDSGTPAPSDDGSSEIIFKGILTKQGKKHKTWRKRVMLLRKDHRIYYYKNIARPPLGVIPLTDTVFSFRQGWQDDCNWPRGVDLARTITIITEGRTFYVYADTLAQVEQWHEQLAFVEKVQKQKQKKATGGDASRALKSRMKKDKLNRQRTQRFQSSEDGDKGEGADENVISSDSSTSDLEDLDIQNVSDTMVAIGVYATLDQDPCDEPTADKNRSGQSRLDDKALTDVSALNPSDEQELYIVPDEGRNSVISMTPSSSDVPEEKRVPSLPLPQTPTEATKVQADKEQDIYEFVADGLYESVHVEDMRIPDGSESPATELKGGNKSQPAPPPLPKERVSASNLLQPAPDNFEPEDTYATVDENQGNEQRIPNSGRPLTLRPPLPATGSSGNSDAFEPAESADDFYANADLESAQEVCYEEMTSPEPQDDTSTPFPVSGQDKRVEDQQIYDLPSSPNALCLGHSCGQAEVCLVPTDGSGYVQMGSSSSSQPLPQDSEAIVGENAEETESAGFQRQGSGKFTKSEEGGYKTVKRDSTSSKESDVDPGEVPLHDDASQEVKDPQPSASTKVQVTSKLNEGETPSKSATCKPPSVSNKEPLPPKEQDVHEQDITVLVHHSSTADADATSASNGQDSCPSTHDQTEQSSEQSQSVTNNLLNRKESLTRRSGSFMFQQRQSKAIQESAEEGTTTASYLSALDAKIAVDIVTLEREKQQVHEERRRLEQEWRKLEEERQKLAQERKDFQKELSNVSSKK